MFHKYTLLLLVLLFSVPSLGLCESGTLVESSNSSGSILTDTGSIIVNKTGIEQLNESKNQLIKTITGDTQINEQIKSLETINTKKDIEISTLQSLNLQLQEKIDESLRQKDLSEQEKIQLQEINKNYKQSISNNLTKLSQLESEKLNNSMILESLAETKLALQQQSKTIWNTKLITVSIITMIFILGFILIHFLHNYFKDSEEYLSNTSKEIYNLNIVNMTLSILFTIFVFGSILYLKPELAVGFLFFGSAILMILKDVILSFFASIYILIHYNITDYVTIYEGSQKRSGMIVKFKPLNIVIKEFNPHSGQFTGEIFKVPNKLVFESTFQKMGKNYSNYSKSSITFPISSEKTSQFKKIEDYLSKNLSVKQQKELGVYYNEFLNEKYKKFTHSDDEGKLFVEYSWVDSPEHSEVIKQECVNLYLLLA